jgi:atlastin
MTADGPAITEGIVNDCNSEEGSFAWRWGNQRQTTGIWMWSEPFIRDTKDHGRIAVLLMDTQGMFDSETTMSLTAQIFGLSTFVSSYQVNL